MEKTGSIKESVELIVIGSSSGGISALRSILTALPADFSIPLVLIVHRLKNVRNHLHDLFQGFTSLKVKEVEEKEKIRPGYVYIAPANYHLLIESDRSFSLIVDEPVNFSRPSIDVSFVSAAEVYRQNLLGILLSGANDDGAKGLLSIYENKGKVYVQDPEEAQVQTMPQAALNLLSGTKGLKLSEIAEKICALSSLKP